MSTILKKNLNPVINVNFKSAIHFALIFKALCTFLFSHIMSYDEKDSFEVEKT